MRVGGFALLVMLLAVSASAGGGPDDGELDPSFGNGGRSFWSIGPGYERATEIGIGRDGTILVAGDVNLASGRRGEDVAVVRYTSRGTPDRSFGRRGVVRLDLGRRSEDDLAGMLVQRDGKIVVVAITESVDGDVHVGDWGAGVFRLTANGRLDRTFGRGGRALLELRLGHSVAIALDPSGRIVLGWGTANVVAKLDRRIQLLRLDRAGRRDTTFGRNGLVSRAIPEEVSVNELAFRPDGTFVAVGRTEELGRGRHFTVLSLDRNAGVRRLERTTFGNEPEGADDAVLTRNGKVVAAGYTNAREDTTEFACISFCMQPALARYALDGTLDQTFDGDGRVTLPIEISPLIGHPSSIGIAEQPDGKVVYVATAVHDPREPCLRREPYPFCIPDPHFLVARLLPSGRLDPMFGGDGIVFTDMHADRGKDVLTGAVAVARDGRIVVAGGSEHGNELRFALARYRASP